MIKKEDVSLAESLTENEIKDYKKATGDFVEGDFIDYDSKEDENKKVLVVAKTLKERKLQTEELNKAIFVGDYEKVLSFLDSGADLKLLTDFNFMSVLPVDVALSAPLNKNRIKILSYLLTRGGLAIESLNINNLNKNLKQEKFAKWAEERDKSDYINYIIYKLLKNQTVEYKDVYLIMDLLKEVYEHSKLEYENNDNVLRTLLECGKFEQISNLIKEKNLSLTLENLNKLMLTYLNYLLEAEKTEFERRNIDFAKDLIIKNKEKLTQSAANHIFNKAIAQDRLDILKIAFEFNIKPKDWKVKSNNYRYLLGGSGGWVQEDILITSYVVGIQDRKLNCYSFLKKLNFLKPKDNLVFPPYLMENYSLGEVQNLIREGFKIDEPDKYGNNILHYWANKDGLSPRSGWATLLKDFPSLITQINTNGKTAVDIQIEKIRNTYKWKLKAEEREAKVLEFQKSLSKIESRTINKEISSLVKKKASAKNQEECNKRKKRL